MDLAALGQADTGIEQFLTLEAAGWKGKAGGAIATRPRERAFFVEACRALAERDALEILALRGRDRRPAAMAINLLEGDALFTAKIAYDEAVRGVLPRAAALPRPALALPRLRRPPARHLRRTRPSDGHPAAPGAARAGDAGGLLARRARRPAPFATPRPSVGVRRPDQALPPPNRVDHPAGRTTDDPPAAPRRRMPCVPCAQPARPTGRTSSPMACAATACSPSTHLPTSARPCPRRASNTTSAPCPTSSPTAKPRSSISGSANHPGHRDERRLVRAEEHRAGPALPRAAGRLPRRDRGPRLRARPGVPARGVHLPVRARAR